MKVSWLLDVYKRQLEELKVHTFQKYDAFTVGEVFNMKEEELQEFIGEHGHVSTMFDFSQHLLTAGEHGWYEQRPFCFEAWRDALFTAQEKAASELCIRDRCQNAGFWKEPCTDDCR